MAQVLCDGMLLTERYLCALEVIFSWANMMSSIRRCKQNQISWCLSLSLKGDVLRWPDGHMPSVSSASVHFTPIRTAALFVAICCFLFHSLQSPGQSGPAVASASDSLSKKTAFHVKSPRCSLWMCVSLCASASKRGTSAFLASHQVSLKVGRSCVAGRPGFTRRSSLPQ